MVYPAAFLKKLHRPGGQEKKKLKIKIKEGPIDNRSSPTISRFGVLALGRVRIRSTTLNSRMTDEYGSY